MYCHRCGNQLPDASMFCNRCGARMRAAEAKPRHPGSIIPPPRPARRYPVIESQYSAAPPEEDEEIYYDDQDEYQDEDQEEDQPEDRQKKRPKKQSEKVIFRIHQAFYPAAVAYFFASVCTIAIGALVYYLSLPYTVALVGAVICFVPAIIRHMQLVNTIYILTNTKIEIETGIFSKSSRNIPLRHVLDVLVSETFKERLIGIGDILIDTASTDSKMKLDNINDPRKYADMILNQLHNWG
jgi:membrane protein YdbS with pleckstrin-like domain